MSKENQMIPESSNRTRVSPYPLRSSRTKKYKAHESFIQSEWEDVRGEVFETTKGTSTASRFMNAKPRSCPIDDCNFSGTYSQLDKHLKKSIAVSSPPKVDPQRQCRWEQNGETCGIR
ncbi:unnamed protein product [Arabidopsis lyrata]|uniref:Predicted protein n=1 Tax=Arabidopsis lyrata subsp. lyrata TaxID=81972 RepID=D7MK08_ARALL|nr:predicted protein [Arabidopsis lyrata subsp. lyrata]CAH8277390.1 unnamed protein product [Arabidopsis lyrata]